MKKEKLISYLILLGVALGLPGIIYLIRNNGNIAGYNGEYFYFLNDINNSLNKYGSVVFALIVILMFVIYLKLIKKSEEFNGIKDILLKSAVVGLAFLVVLPNTSKDVFFYMGNGRAIDKYGVNPYITTVRRDRRI